MRTYLECVPCFFIQALRAAKICGLNEKKTKIVLDDIGAKLKDIPLESSPPETGVYIYEKINLIAQDGNPFRKVKSESTKRCLQMYPKLKQVVNSSNDRLLTAIRIAIAGNIIDFGANGSFNIKETVNKVLTQQFAIFDYDKFKYALDNANRILYIGDNAGESVFDRILIEELKKPVIFAVRGLPVINDVTTDDAIEAGIDKSAKIVSSGSHIPGTIIKKCNHEFKQIYHSSDFIISKGQGNYETLSDENKTIFFLLMVKCKVIANHIGVNKGDIILKCQK